jgi:hypothetical protein
MTDVVRVERLYLEIQGEADVDGAELMELTTELRTRLLEIADLADVAPVADPRPAPGTKSGGAFLPGALTLVGTLGTVAVSQVFQTVRSWLEHRPVLRVSVRENGAEYEISGPPDQVDRHLDRLLERRRQAGGPDDG